MSEFNRELVSDWVAIWNNYDPSRVKKLFLDDARAYEYSYLCCFRFIIYSHHNNEVKFAQDPEIN